MESFIIEGGHPLKGTITPQGAKNEALEVICTTILTDEPVRITNVPDILDVNNLIKLLKEIGVKVTQNSRHDYTFQSDELNLADVARLPLPSRVATRLVVAVLIPIFWDSSIWVPALCMMRSAMCI